MRNIEEPGNNRFDILQSADEPARFALYEAYVSAKDATVHKQTAHYLAWRETVADMMAEPRTGYSLQRALPGNMKTSILLQRHHS